MTTDPALTLLSLGAGVQSTTLALLAIDGQIPRPDIAIFADTGWEPAAVYRQVDRVRDLLDTAGIELVTVTAGNLRTDALSPDRPTNVPAFTRGTDGRAAPTSRQCTDNYKLRPIRAEVRLRLGATRSQFECRHCAGVGRRVNPYRADGQEGSCGVCAGTGQVTRVGQPPAGQVAVVQIGFSADEISRVSNRGPGYLRNAYPLLDLSGAAGREGWTRGDCRRYLTARGWGDIVKSACIGCPFHGNAAWRELRRNPVEWNDAVAFDHANRVVGDGMRGERYLHRSLLPLDQAPIDTVTAREWGEAQGDLFDELEQGDPDGCSPYACRSGKPVE